MKKLFAIVALSLVIAGSMAAGTMAQYVKTTSVTANPQFKQFNFSAAGVANQSLSLEMAPGETQSWTYNVSNTEGGVGSETDMLVTLGLDGTNIPNGMLFYVNDELYTGAALQVAALKGGAADLTTFVLKAVWNTSGSDSYDTSWQGYKGASVTLNLTATQASLNNFALLTNVTVSNQIPSSMKTQSSKVGTAFTATYNVNGLTGNFNIEPAFTITGIKDPSQLVVTIPGVIDLSTYLKFKDVNHTNTFTDTSGTNIFDNAQDLIGHPDSATYKITYYGNVIGTYTINLVNNPS